MRLLDTFCCEGGASMGYSKAGFDVYGIDNWLNYNRRRYPFPSHQDDAVDVLWRLGNGHKIEFNNGDTLGLDDFDVITASPPCQTYSISKYSHDNVHDDLLQPVRTLLRDLGKPYVIENVIGATLKTPLLLCGTMFRLHTIDTDGRPLYLKRHRLFESDEYLAAKGRCRCKEYDARDIGVGGVYGGGSADRSYAKNVRRGGYTPGLEARSALLGIHWMSRRGMSQAIPPAYTQFIGHQLIEALCPSA